MTMTNCVQNMDRGQNFGIGSEVENDDIRFFVGAINDSGDMCAIDKTKPWTLKNKKSVMAKCIEHGNYSASAKTLTVSSNALIRRPPLAEATKHEEL
jgi:hypothetical protein